MALATASNNTVKAGLSRGKRDAGLDRLSWGKPIWREQKKAVGTKLLIASLNDVKILALKRDREGSTRE